MFFPVVSSFFSSRSARSSSVHADILRLAIPSILANITIPLVGLVDTAIVGHISDATAIGGIAIGTMLFDLLYWNFGFLRVGTSGLTAQAYGRYQQSGEVGAIPSLLLRSLRVAFLGALACILIQWIFVKAVLALVPCSAPVADFATHYFFIRIWAAPATLGLMALKGWFIGMQDTVRPMATDIVVNVVNMAASFYLAVCTPLQGMGVAWGTLIAQYTGLVLALVLLLTKYRSFFAACSLREVFALPTRRKPSPLQTPTNPSLATTQTANPSSHAPSQSIAPSAQQNPSSESSSQDGRLFSLNSQLFVRSLCFMVVYVGFTALASKYGDTELAVSALMMKLFMLFSYFVDGFAYAGEALVGKHIGASETQTDRSSSLSSLVRVLFVWSLAVGLLFTLLYAFFGERCMAMMTDSATVLSAALPYRFWLIAMPLASTLAFMWDGVFVGAAAGKDIRNAMIYAALFFVVFYVACASFLGVHALYLAYFAHLLARVIYLTIRWPRVQSSL